jgi:tungstate transport system substrate-binding protein
MTVLHTRIYRIKHRITIVLCAQAALFFIAFSAAHAQNIVLASTTSTEQSGLFSHLLPAFERASGIHVKVVAVGSGQALDMARRGDADVLLVHDPAAEEQLVQDGFGLARRTVMYNDFILVGPQADPAQARGQDIAKALHNIRANQAVFVSRGDRSGTHSAELRYWRLAAQATPLGSNYLACGCGMGAALNMAAYKNAYVLSDRGTWQSFKNRADLKLLVEGDMRLRNVYSVIVVNPSKHPHVKHIEAAKFADWVTSPAGQNVINAYKIAGQSLFFPLAK